MFFTLILSLLFKFLLRFTYLLIPKFIYAEEEEFLN